MQTLQSGTCVVAEVAIKCNREAGKAWNRSGRQRRGPKRAVSASTPGAATSSLNGSVRSHCFLWARVANPVGGSLLPTVASKLPPTQACGRARHPLASLFLAAHGKFTSLSG